MDSKKNEKSLVAKIGLSVAAVIVVVGLVGWFLITGKLSLIHKVENENRIDRNEENFENDEHNGGESIDANAVDLNEDDVKTFMAEDVKNILFIGYDARTGEERGRADSIIICSINRKTKTIKLVSIMRDTYVAIPGFSKNRINAAYIFGGMSLLDEVIEKNFGVKVDGNIAVDFDAFVSSLTAVGNLDIYLTKQEADYLNYGEDFRDYKWKLKEGVNSLTPEQALAYARTRKVGQGDFARTERQRKVIISAFNKVKNLSLSEINSLANKVLPCISTDMTNGIILGLISQVGGSNYSINETMRIPVDDAWKYAMINDKMSVVLPDLAKNSVALQEFIYGQTAEQAGNTAQ